MRDFDISKNQMRDAIDRTAVVVVTAVFVLLLALLVMATFGAFERKEDAGKGKKAAVVPASVSYTETDAETTEAETVPETTTAPSIDPEVLAAYDPGTMDSSAAVASVMAQRYPDTVLGVTEDAGAEYLARIVFLGDSTTYGLRRYSMLPEGRDTKQVWTPSSGTLTLSQANIATIVYPETDEEITIAEAVERKKPDILVITLGVNGVSFMKEEYFKDEYTKLVQNIRTISPATKIILQSIFPIARSYDKQAQINNTNITEANRWILDVAVKCGVKYLDTTSILADEEGFLPESYQNGDGIHFNETGFKAELDYIRCHAWPNP